MMNTNTISKFSKISQKSENALLALWAVYLLYLYSFNSTYYFFWSLEKARYLLFTMAAVGGLKTATSMLANRVWNRKLIPALALSFIYIGVYYTSKSIFFLFLAVLTVAFIGTDYHKVIKIAVVMGLAFLVVSFFGVFAGIIDNFVYFRNGHLRSSWGFSYTTDMVSFLLFIVGFAWIAWEEIPDELILLGTLLCTWISFVFASSRTSVACCIIFILILVYHMTETRILFPRHRLRHASDTMQQIATYSFPIMALLFGICLLLYVKILPIGLQLNTALSGRLSQTAQIWHDKGLHPFGSSFYTVGNGGSTINPGDNYYFLDCSYALILIQYGWLLLITFGILWCALSHRARKKHNLRLLLMMVVISVHSFSEHHFSEVMYNTLLPLFFSYIPDISETTSTLDAGAIHTEPTLFSYCKKQRKHLISMALAVLILCLSAPLLLSRTRTLLSIYGYLGSSCEKFRILAQLVLFLVLISSLASSATRIILSCGKRRGEKKLWPFIISGICILGLVGIYIRETRSMVDGRNKYSSIIETDREAMQLIIDTSEGKVCTEIVPELYKEEFGKISRTVLCGDDLARLKCGTVIADMGTDRPCYFNMGFSFTPISEHHAAYSNDSSVIDALAAAGFIWSDFYNATFDIDLHTMAAMNGLPLTSKGTLIIDGADNSLQNGPCLDLYAGTYIVSAELKAPVEAEKNNNLVCTILITDYYDGHLLQEYPVLQKTVDNDHLIAHIPFCTKGSRNTEIHFAPSSGKRIELTQIQYRKLSNMPQTGWVLADDIWYYLDSSGKMMTGWVLVNGKWYFLNDSGEMQTGWILDDGTRYYLKSSGEMMTGWVLEDDIWYYLNSSGKMQTGWVLVNGYWYFLNNSGEMQTGWILDDGTQYYLNNSGKMMTGWAKVDENWYYFNSSGEMQTGWIEIAGKWYYLEDNGVMLSDTQKRIGNKIYRFDESGMCINH